ncbi:MAG TPA: Ig-like domain-containing protein [Spirochaetota bacterium]|nr:Ig-like domain-containing protein [Spirochaetota bacterium]HPI90018.1 Ig-like domain-containing protein [Spirochaetota bacterium]HPR48100.1 Ig-like domain-containing protein [Spirochaetota bacterium]
MKTKVSFLLLGLLFFLINCDGDDNQKNGGRQAELEILSTFPVHGGADVFPDTAITIRFNNILTSPLPESAVIVSGTGTVNGECSLDENKTAIICTPAGKLDENTTYTVTVSADIEDSARDTLDSDYSFQFTTINRRGTETTPVFCNYESKYAPRGETLQFTTPLDNAVIQTGTAADTGASEPDAWADTDSITLSSTGTIIIFARATDMEGAIGNILTFSCEVVDSFPGVNSDQAIVGDDHLDRDDSSIIAWPSACAEFIPGLDRTSASPAFDDTGAALNGEDGFINIGNTGSLTLVFDPPLCDGTGPDLAVFENGFSTTGGLTAEYGYIEVSSDGHKFARFDTATLRDPASVPDPDTIMSGWDTTLDWGVMGKYPAGTGDLFDLEWLKNKREVVEGRVDLDRISHVRIVDIIGIDETRLMGPDESSWPRADHKGLISSSLGNYDSSGSFGNTIFDEYPTVGTGGLEIDTIGALHVCAP